MRNITTDPRRITCKLAAALAALPFLTFGAVVVTTAPESVGNGETAPVEVNVISSAEVAAVRLWFSLSGNSEVSEGYAGNCVDLKAGAVAGQYAGVIPRVPAGTLNWKVRVEYANGTYEDSDEKVTTILSELKRYTRTHDMKGITGLADASGDYYDSTYGWRQVGTSNDFNADSVADATDSQRWKAHYVSWAYSKLGTQQVPKPTGVGRNIGNLDTGSLEVPFLYFWNELPSVKPFIRTPKLDGGLGIIAYKARNLVGTSTLHVQISQLDSPGDNDADWTNIDNGITLTRIPTSTNPTLSDYFITNIVNTLDAKYVRIVRTSINSGGTASQGVVPIDDIVVTPAPPEISLTDGERVPAAPVTGKEIAIQCLVSNVLAQTPAFNKSVTVYYAFAASESASVSSWAHTTMTYAGETNGCALFTATLPSQLEAGYYHYYYKCDFDGYFYGSKSLSGFSGKRYLYSNETTAVAPADAPPHLTIHVPEREYKVSIVSAPSSLSESHTGTIVALHTGDQAPTSVKLYFSLINSSFVSSEWNYIEMTPGGNAGEYTTTLPILPPGTLSWYVEVEYADAEPEPSKLQSTTINPDLDYTRFHDMKGMTGIISASGSYYDATYGWQHEGGNATTNPSTNFYANAVAGTTLDSQRWIASGVGWGATSALANNAPKPNVKGRSIANLYAGYFASHTPILYLKNFADETCPPFIRTPILVGGAGRVSFNAHSQQAGNSENRIQVQVCYLDSPAEWHEKATFDYTSANTDYLNQSVVINDLSVKYVRIVRLGSHVGESLDYGVIGIDDFLVTPASPDVSLAERFRNPGYPAVGQDITLQCAVSNLSEITPALNISVKAFYALASSAASAISSSQWRPVTMDLKSSENGVSVFECQVPAQTAAGWLHYYFQCSFDGYCHGSKTPGAADYNGWNSPEYLYLDTATATNAPPTASPPHLDFEVRQYRSRYSAVKLRTDSGDGQPVLTDMILNGDHQWQASIPVEAGATVNAYFVGHDLYEDGADGFATYLRYYGDNDQEYLTTPSGGTAEPNDAVTNTLASVAITTDKDGFLLYNLDDSDNGATYTVRKGFYQDFNSWVVNGDYYVESHAGMTIGERTENFERWKSSTENTDTPYDDFLMQEASRDAPPNLATDFTIGGVGALYDETEKGWELSAARYSCERITNYLATVINPISLSAPFSNTVAQIKEGGGFQSTLDENSLAHGLGTISAVMRSAIGDNVKAVLDTNTYSWACSYQNSDWSTNKALFIEASFEIPPQESPNNHYYVSVLFDYQNEKNFYEVRYKRNDTNSGNAKDNRARVEIRRTINGTDAGLAGWDVSSDQVMNGSTVLLKIRHRRSAASQMQTHVGLMIGTHNYWGSYNAQNSDNTPGVLVNGGGVAICAYDCAPKVNYLKVYGGGTDGKVYDAAKSSLSEAHDKTFDPTEWSLGSATRPEWYVDSDLALRRRIPEMTVDLYVKPADATVQYHTSDLVDTFTVNSLTFQNFSYPVHSPESKMFRFVVREADGNYIVLDKVSGSHWRAANRSNSEQEGKHGDVECYKWTDASTQQTPWMRADNQMYKWLILEGWAKTNNASGTFTAAAFQKSQAHPDLVQGLVSPIMTNGIGSVMFNYRVSGDGVSSGKVVYAIEYTNPLGSADNPDFDGAVTEAVVTNTLGAASGNSGSKTFDINTNYCENAVGGKINMRLRIRIIPEETDPDVILWLDEVVVKDYPKAGDDTWEVYNGRIADAEAEPTVVYGHAGKTLFLNNSQTSGLVPRTNPFTEKRPCVQSPKLDTGIGEIAFSYRALTSTAQGRFTVAISDDASLPDENWTEIATITVSDTSGYVSFDNMSIHKRDKYFVRIFSETNGYGRVCIDNILVAEPIDPTFEINSVTLVPKQPVLSTTNLVSVRASVANRRLNPRNIRLFASYHEGSNVWGVSNWCDWRTDTAVELFPDSTGTNYSSAAETGLPQDVQNNGVVQYVVWGFAENSPEGDRILENEDCFTPPTGLPNLNELYTNSIPGATWSPYYYVMESPVGVVWFNEVWIGRNNSEEYPNEGTPYEFIELAGQPGAKIGGWRIDVYSGTSPKLIYSLNINPGSKLGNNGIWVIGDEGTPNVNQVAVINDKTAQPGPGNGTREMFGGFPRELVLVRNNETIECAVYARNSGDAVSPGTFPYGGEQDGIPSVYISNPAKGTAAETGLGYSYALMNQPFDLGEDYDENQNTAWTSGFYGTTWYWTAGMPSPGEPNWSQRPDGSGRAYQTLPGGGVVPASLRLVSKIIGAAFGTQNGVVTDIDIDVESVGSTSIVYVANSWYKINALVSDNSEVGAASGATAYTFSISANSMSGDVTNYVYFTEKTAADYASNPEGTRWTKAILDWFRANGWSEDDIAGDDGDGWTVWDEFLLNTDPTLHTEVDCRTSSFAIADDAATLGLYLERTEGGGTVYRPLNGAVNIYGVADLADLAAGATKVSSGGKGLFDGTTGETRSFSLDGLGLNFFIWKIEAE